MTLTRMVVVFVGVLFVVVGLAFSVTPEPAAQIFDLEPIGVSALVTLRGDLGGLFLFSELSTW